MKSLLFRFILFFNCFFGATNSFAQSTDWVWAQAAVGDGGGFNWDHAYGVCTDALGNIYVAGAFASDSIKFGNFTLKNADTVGSTQDIFIVKYDASGNVLWAQSAGGIDEDWGLNLSTNDSGDVFLGGDFESDSLTFGNFTILNSNTTTHYENIFLVKFNSQGNVLWAKSEGGNHNDYPASLSADQFGNIFVAGYFCSDTCAFGNFVQINPDTNHSPQMFIVKYSSSGNVLWATSAGGINFDEAFSVSADVSGNVFVTGKFSSPSITFGNLTLINTDPSGANSDFYITKFDATGSVLWTKSSGGIGHSEYGTSVSTDTSGNVYACGWFSSPAITFGTTTLNNAGGIDLFLVKYDANGNVLWAKRAGGTSWDYGYTVSTDIDNNVYMEGSFYSPSITFGTYTFTISPANHPMYIVKYDSTGNLLCAAALESGGIDDGFQKVSADRFGNAYVCGNFGGVASPFTVGSTILNGAGIENVFIAKYKCTPLDASVTDVSNTLNMTNIFPNPSNGKFTIENTSAEKIEKVEVYNAIGDKIFEISNCNQQTEIDLSLQSNGMYFIAIKTGSGIETKKIMIQK